MKQDEVVKQDEVESQLSAMFDGELPAAECELLSRRIDRDDRLRARWSRYASIGAAMRCEPVATARSDFASRVSRAVDREVDAQAVDLRRHRRNRYVWQSALAASLVAAVAGISLTMLRQVAWQSSSSDLHAAARTGLDTHAPAELAAVVLHSGAGAAAASGNAPSMLHASLNAPGAAQGAAAASAGALTQEPFSYVTPSSDAADPTGLRTELVDYIVAHSGYSTPLMQPDLLSSVVSGEDPADDAVHSTATAGDADAPSAATASGR